MKDVLNKIQRQVDSVRGRRIVAPFYPGAKIQVRVNGAILELEHDMPNWAMPSIEEWEVVSDSKVKHIGDVTAHQVFAYFELLPQIRAITVFHDKNDHTKTFMIQSRPGQLDVVGSFPAILHTKLHAGVNILQEYIVAFDGMVFWIVSQPAITSMEARAASDYRGALKGMVEPGFKVHGSWPGLRKAYEIALAHKLESEKSRELRHVELALKHAGSKLLEFNEQDGKRFKVTFDVGGHSKTVTVDKNLNILTAGICLVDHHGQHNRGHTLYDLQSFVGVMREYHHK